MITEEELRGYEELARRPAWVRLRPLLDEIRRLRHENEELRFTCQMQHEAILAFTQQVQFYLAAEEKPDT